MSDHTSQSLIHWSHHKSLAPWKSGRGSLEKEPSWMNREGRYGCWHEVIAKCYLHGGWGGGGVGWGPWFLHPQKPTAGAPVLTQCLNTHSHTLHNKNVRHWPTFCRWCECSMQMLCLSTTLLHSVATAPEHAWWNQCLQTEGTHRWNHRSQTTPFRSIPATTGKLAHHTIMSWPMKHNKFTAIQLL